MRGLGHRSLPWLPPRGEACRVLSAIGLLQRHVVLPSRAPPFPDPPPSGLLAPRWREDARGVLLGISRYTTKAHVARAVLEAMAFQV